MIPSPTPSSPPAPGGRSPRPWDLLVVGGGTAGLVAAHTGAVLGARVALVEEHRTGGDCLWTGCVPSKALLSAAGVVATLRRDHGFASAGEVSVDFGAVMARVNQAIATIEPVDSPEALREAGVTVVTGRAEFDGPGSVRVAGERHLFRRAVLATGSTPVVPDVPGLRDAGPVTSETVWDLTELPGRLLILGGGPVGCEMSQAFARLGSRVTLVHRGERLLPRHDPDASAAVRRALTSDGVEIITGHEVARVDGSPGRPGVATVGLDGAGERRLDYDVLLLATGQRPRTAGLGLDLAGVRLTDDGAVAVDPRLRTTNPRIFAAGDVTPAPQLTHLASYHAGIAATNALLGLPLRPDTTAVPQVVYTDPEVAAVGAPTWAPPGRRTPRTTEHGHDHVDRAVTDGRTDGFTRLTLTATGRIAGATVVGPRAGESLAELGLAVRQRIRVTALASTVHAYPTYAYAPWEAAVTEVRRRSARWGLWRLTRVIVLLRRVRGVTGPP